MPKIFNTLFFIFYKNCYLLFICFILSQSSLFAQSAAPTNSITTSSPTGSSSSTAPTSASGSTSSSTTGPTTSSATSSTSGTGSGTGPASPQQNNLPMSLPTAFGPAAPFGINNSTSGVVEAPKPSPGKYDGHLSLCRENDYDHLYRLNPEIQKKRVSIIQEKLKSPKASNKLKILLFKEYIWQNNQTEALSLYTQLKDDTFSDEEKKIIEALNLVIKGDFKQSEKILTQVVISNSKNFDALKILAEINKINNNYYESTAAYFDLNKYTKDNVDLEQCEVYTLYAQYTEAENFCKKAISKFPTNPYPYVYLGIAQREKSNFAEATIKFNQALVIQPNEMAYTCLGENLYLSGLFESSIENYKKAINLHENSVRAKMGLIWSLIKSKKTNDAYLQFKNICKLNSFDSTNSKNPFLKKNKIHIKNELKKIIKVLIEEKSKLSSQFLDLSSSCID